MKKVFLGLAIGLSICMPLSVRASQSVGPGTPSEAKTAEIVRQARASAITEHASDSLPILGTPSPQMVAAYQQAQIARYNEVQYRSDHVRWVYDSQYWSSWIILFVVVSIVAAGLAFSLVQLRMAQAAAQKNIQSAQQLGGTVRLSPSGIEVTSSVLGTITLVISALFLWLYLQTVYPITTQGPAPLPVASLAPK